MTFRRSCPPGRIRPPCATATSRRARRRAPLALSTIALYASYALPIAVGLRARRTGRWKTRGPWDLGRFSAPVNAIALAWVAIITVLFVLPPNLLAGYTFAGSVGALALLWFFSMRARFRGPPVLDVAGIAP